MDLEAFLILTVRLGETPARRRALLRTIARVPCLLVNHIKLGLAQMGQLAFAGLLLVGALPAHDVGLLLTAARDVLFGVH